MNTELYTVSDIADRIDHVGPLGMRDQMLRQVRYWTSLGILPHAGPAHRGSGKHRRYSLDAVYVAAVISALANGGLGTGALTLAASPLRLLSGLPKADDNWPKHYGNRQEALRLWKAAIEGKEPVVAVFGFFGSQGSSMTIMQGFHIGRANDLDIIGQVEMAATVSLTKIFEGIRA